MTSTMIEEQQDQTAETLVQKYMRKPWGNKERKAINESMLNKRGQPESAQGAPKSKGAAPVEQESIIPIKLKQKRFVRAEAFHMGPGIADID